MDPLPVAGRPDRAGGEISFGSPIFSNPGSVGDGRMELSLSATADRSLFVFRASTFERAPEIYAAKPGNGDESGAGGCDPAFAS